MTTDALLAGTSDGPPQVCRDAVEDPRAGWDPSVHDQPEAAVGRSSEMRSSTVGERACERAQKRRLNRWRTGRVGVSGSAIERSYVDWLQQESMLGRGGAVASQFAGAGGMSQRPFAHSNPRAAIEKASVWFTAYPISMITRTGESFLGTLAGEDLWRVFEAIGVDAVHTGPVKRAGRHLWLGPDS